MFSPYLAGTAAKAKLAALVQETAVRGLIQQARDASK